MWRGTTPVYTFSLPEGLRLDDFSVAYLTFTQNGQTVLEKNIDELEPAENGFQLSFFAGGYPVLQSRPGQNPVPRPDAGWHFCRI